MAEDWSEQEVTYIVDDHFTMLVRELKGEPFHKAAHRNALRTKLDHRSDGSIEFKHQNISAVLSEMGLPFIKGYKPRRNFQRLLIEHVRNYLNGHEKELQPLFEAFAAAIIPADLFSTVKYADCLEVPPLRAKKEGRRRTFNTFKVNYLEKEQQNRALGVEGEEWVMEYEKWRLAEAKRQDLIDKVEWVSRDRGDGAGYDILSKNVDGSDRYIEVKTTKLSKETPIYVTSNEIAFADKHSESFYLYRVFQAGTSIRLFIRQGRYEDYCQLEAVTYRGVF